MCEHRDVDLPYEVEVWAEEAGVPVERLVVCAVSAIVAVGRSRTRSSGAWGFSIADLSGT